jgi:hypothetical protein
VPVGSHGSGGLDQLDRVTAPTARDEPTCGATRGSLLLARGDLAQEPDQVPLLRGANLRVRHSDSPVLNGPDQPQQLQSVVHAGVS